jgi:perosamine synthetase
VTAPGAGHSYQAYVVLFAPETPTADNVALLSEQRNAVMAQLEAQGIGTRQGTHSLPHTSYYARRYDIAPEAFPQSKIAESLSIALPLYPDMTDDDIATVAEALHTAVAAQGV